MSDYIPDFTPDEAAEYEAWLDSFGDEKYIVRCKVCDAPDCDTQQHLQLKGWALSGQGEYCPSH